MRKLAAALIFLALSLFAADFWQSKPFTEWSDKDVQKMVTNSPWARPLSLTLGNPMPPSAGGGGRGRGGGGGAGAMGADSSMGDLSSSGMGTSGGRGGRGGGLDDTNTAVTSTSITLTLRWQSALPVRQALIRMKYGAEASSSAEAKKFLDQEQSGYIIAVSGIMRSALARQGEALKKAVMEQTSLSAKGKDPLKPTDLEIKPGEKMIVAYFLFPKTTPFTPDDKDVEFATKLGPLPVKYKFHLKEMVFSGKLEL